MNNLEEIRGLLFGDEQEKLAKLDRRVSIPELRADDVASVLPTALKDSHEAGPQLVRRLKPPVEQCIRTSLRESPQEYADALYPVMGPAIRRSISETFKAYTQQINQSMEQSLSLKYLRWRMEASRAGVPFAQYVLQKTLQYRVEQGYLISRDSGMLIAHVHQDATQLKDNDAVSAMFTAIQDFVKDSFSDNHAGRLQVADMGEYALWAAHGPHAVLVCVIRGVAPNSLHASLSGLLERLHANFEYELSHFMGRTEAEDDIEYELAECLTWQALTEKEASRSWLRKPVFWLILVLLAAVFWWGFRGWQNHTAQSSLRAAFAETPGIYLDRIERRDDTYIIYGLRDPLAAEPGSIIAQTGLQTVRWESALQPYRSLDPSIATQRTLAVINPPDSISVDAKDGRITLSGSAPQRWRQRVVDWQASGLFDVPVDVSRVSLVEQSALDALLEQHERFEILFSGGTDLVDEQSLDAVAVVLREAVPLAEASSQHVVVTVVGGTDALGTVSDNELLAQARADLVVASLQSRVQHPRLRWEIAAADIAEQSVDARRRRVVVALSSERL
ncbi:MAG: hypothetical protein AAF290_07230 [Pseudomonadota bacterium]